MASPFDLLQNRVFDTALRRFGHPAQWTSQDGTASYSGTVLIKSPSRMYRLNELDFSVDEYYMEYRRGQFEGLRDRAQERNTLAAERVTISGQEFIVNEVLAFHDGLTYRATIVPAN